jgi:hypothetical protein
MIHLIGRFIPVRIGYFAVQKRQPRIGLSRAVCELFSTLAFRTLAAGIGTITSATTRMVQKLIFGEMGVRQPPDSNRG